MNNLRFELNGAGVRELLKSPEMNSVLAQCADAVVSNAGEGFEKHIYVGNKRIAYTITAETVKAYRSNMKHNTLVNALGAAKR